LLAAVPEADLAALLAESDSRDAGFVPIGRVEAGEGILVVD
jgi:hypothetical protein